MRDEYFLNICKAVGAGSKCLSRQIGAIIVKNNSVISTGYNGPPKGITHCRDRLLRDDNLLERLRCIGYDIPEEEGTIWFRYNDGSVSDAILTECPRYLLGAKSGEMTDICPATHAEVNAIIQSPVNVGGCSIYMDCPVPCSGCLKIIINAEIKEIVCTSLDFYDNMSKYLLNDSMNLTVRTYDGEYYKRWKN